MALGIIAIVFIAVAGFFFLVFVGTIAVTYPIFRAHRRKMADLERQIIAKEIGSPPEVSSVTGPPIALRKSFHLPGSGTAVGWDVLPSNEDLHDEYEKGAPRKQEKRKSGSWAMLRRKSTKRAKLTKQPRATALSTIVESPRTTERPVSELDETERPISMHDNEGPAIGTAVSCDPEPADAEAATPTKATSHPHSGSPAPSVTPSEALRPAPLRFSKRKGDVFETLEIRPSIRRSVTVPAILIGSEDGDGNQDTLRHHRNSRSISFTNLSSAPTAPPPPLPSAVQRMCPLAALQRSSSSGSVTSLESSNSVGSSLLKSSLSPNIKARNEFAERHPETGLGPHLRQHDTDLKATLLEGSRNTSVSASMRNSPRMVSSTASLLVENKSEDADNAVTTTTKTFMEKLQQVGFEDDAARKKDGRPGLAISNASSLTDNPIKVVSTPTSKADLQTRRVSTDLGSPMEREKRSSVLQNIPLNLTLPARNASQTSLQSSESDLSDGNPWQWEHSSPTKRSALKGSPNARKSNHRRSKMVQISMRPTTLGSNRNPSGSRMVEIAEEETDSPSGPYSESNSSHRPPSTPTFQPKLREPTTYHALLKPRSETLGMTDYNNGDLGVAQSSSRAKSRSPGALGRQSVASSILEIPVFPSRANQRATSDEEEESKDQFQTVPTFGPRTSVSPDKKRPIPGLSLIANNNSRNKADLQYPAIDLADSPSSVVFIDPPSPSADAALTPTELLDRALPAASRLPRNLSPPPKAVATTRLSQDFSVTVSGGIGQAVSTHPLDTKPNFSPGAEPAYTIPGHPQGPRAPPAQSIMKTIKGLRRDNSEALRDVTSHRRYLALARTGSNLSNNSLVSSPNLLDVEGAEADKENTPPMNTKRGCGVWDDGEAFWNKQGIVTAADKRNGTQFETPNMVKRKSVTWGEVNYSNTPAKVTPARLTPGSLYDADGFLIGEDDGDNDSD